MSSPSVAEWMDGKDILITGATGFMGKVLIEKLLRYCPGINRLFLIVRTKKGCSPAERMAVFQDELFHPLLKQYPNALDKLVIIPGDLTQHNCGLSEEHQELLKENVSIVFHGAASVRFDDSLTYAFKLNARGTYDLLNLAKQMKKLEVFQYVSTAYSNSYLLEPLEEKVYPTHVDWQSLLSLVDEEEDVLDVLTYKIQVNQPNTYTLTKSIAENMVLEAGEEIPCTIVRPSVVMPIFHDPVVGWVDNLYGLVGVTAGLGKGILRVLHCSENTVMDFVPVDVAINGMIAAAWSTQLEKLKKVEVFNETYSDRNALTNNDLTVHGEISNRIYPMDNSIWYPFIFLAYNSITFHLLFYIYQILPALILDLLLTITGKKRMVLKLNVKIYNATKATMKFTTKKLCFTNKKYRVLHKKMCPEDQERYLITEEQTVFDVGKYILMINYGLKKYFFHEKDEDIPMYRARHQKLYYIHQATKYGFYIYLSWRVYIWAQAALTCALFDC